jgi:hypothetical protein
MPSWRGITLIENGLLLKEGQEAADKLSAAAAIHLAKNRSNVRRGLASIWIEDWFLEL